MSLLLPIALLGLLTLPLILLLHLFRHRRELLPISSLRLWRGLQQKKQGVRPRSIPFSLMLLAQLLIAAALTFGLAQPVSSFLRSRPQQTIFILDTTTSMATEDATGTTTSNRRFDAAREVIRTQLQAMTENDTFAIINLNQRPDILVTGDGEQSVEALQILDNLTPGATGVNLPAALTLANGLLEAEQDNQIIVLSDNNYAVEAEMLPKVFAPLEWQTFGTTLTSPPANQALLNVSARTLADKRYRLFARIINYSEAAVNRTVRLVVDGQMSDETAVQLDPKGETTLIWTLPETAQTAAVEIVEADSLPLDNRAELLLADTTRHEILLFLDRPQEQAETTNETENNILSRAFEAQPDLNLTVADAADLNDYDLSEFDVVVFDGLPLNLPAWPEGNVLVINPPLGHPLLMVENYARNLRPNPEAASPLLEGIDLSGVYFDRLPHVTLPEWAEADLMAVAADGGEQNTPTYPLIFHGLVDNSRIVVWAFDLNESNLPARLALPLLTDNTMSMLLSVSLPPVIALGETVPLEAGLSVELPDGLRLSNAAQTDTGQIVQFSQTQQPGLYKIYDDRNNLMGGFAAHAGSALESNLTTQFDANTIVTVDTGAGEASPEIEYDEYWPWLVALALAIITLEGWFAWRK